jgi:hypothetical protein
MPSLSRITKKRYTVVLKKWIHGGCGSVDFFAMIINSTVIEIDEDNFWKS